MTQETDLTIKLSRHLDDPEFSDFRQAVLSNDTMALVKYFDGMSENERKRHSKYCCEYCKAVEKEYNATPWETTYRYDEDSGIAGATFQGSEKSKKLGDIWRKAKSAVVATASWSTAKDLDRFYDFEEIERILRSRRPEWTLDFLAKIVEGVDLHYGMETYWEIYRRFYREGIVKPRRFDSITELMFAVLSGSRFTEQWKREKGEKGSEVIPALKSDPDLIKHELWHIFGIEAFRRNWCYTTHDRFDKWKDALCELIREKTISSEKVLDGCFAALSRHFTDHQVKWFAQLLERMIEKLPIAENELAVDKRFLDLLDHEHPSPRGLGLKIFERLLKVGAVELDGMAVRLIPALRESVKTKPKKALALLEKMAGKRPDLHSEIFSALLVALEHETTEIQDATMEMLLKFNAFDVPKIHHTVLERSALLAASVRKRIPGDNFGNLCSPTSVSIGNLSPENVGTSPLREAIIPIGTFDELLDSATRLIESADDPDEIERFLDGISRLGSDKPKDFDKMTAPLLKRMLKLLGTDKNTYNSDGTANRLAVFPPFTGENIAADCFYIVLSWVTGEIPKHTILGPKRSYGSVSILSEVVVLGNRWIHWASAESKSDSSAYGIFSAHAKVISEQLVQGVSRQRLSTPTHRGGWIDPIIFVRRLIESFESKEAHDDLDRVLALLRLNFQGREEALVELDSKIKKRDEYVQAVRYALGAAKCKIGKTAHYWIAAGRSRAPSDDIESLEMAFPGLGPDGGEAAIYSLGKQDGYRLRVRCEPASKKKSPAGLFPTMALHSSNTHHYMDARQENPWKLTVWPSNPDPVIGAAIQSHFEYRDDNFDTGFIPYIEALQKNDVTIRKIGAATIFVGLAMKYAAIPMAATDTMIIAISQDRLKLEPIREAIRELLATGLLIPSRWLKPLKIVADQSPKHALFVQEILEGMISLLGTKVIGGFLELLYEITITQLQPIRDKECLQYLKSINGSSKAAKLAKKLLEMK